MPASAVILGGGVIGVEFASAWRSLGAEVTIVEALPHLLPGEEESSSRWLQRAFKKRGIRFELGAKLENVKDDGDGITVTLEGGTTLAAELLLVAVGREPVSAGLGFEEAGVATEHGFVTVDEHCQTGVPTISAVGDLTPGPQLAHVGFAQGILAAENDRRPAGHRHRLRRSAQDHLQRPGGRLGRPDVSRPRPPAGSRPSRSDIPSARMPGA